MANIFIVVPVYNEEQKIKETIINLKKDFSNLVIVDDGSTDNSFKICQKIPDIFLLRHLINRGQGAALRTGTNFALKNGADIIVHFDADGQLDKNDIKKALKKLETEKVEVILGSRFLGIKSESMGVLRKLFLKLGLVFIRFFSGLKLTDSQNGFRVLTKKAALTIKISQDKMAHCSEILKEIGRHNLKHKEIPVKVIYTDYSIKKSDGNWRRTKNILKELMFAKIFRH